MPIYSYRCDNCGHLQDVLQKISAPLLTACPACGMQTYKKQVTAAGFQLKGSGWYVTDFRNPPAKEAAKATSKDDAKPTGDKNAGGASPDTAATPKEGTAPVAEKAPATVEKPKTSAPGTSANGTT